MRFIELFAGIGGFRLGLEPLGWQCVWANEIDPYACKVYRKNFGDKELIEGDIREIKTETIPEFEMLVGGFPCQDISNAGKRAGIEGERSGLFFEIIRIARDLSPRYIFLENAAALLGRGMDVVLRELSEIGYDAQWDCIPASAVGAPHRRDRVWIVAYPKREPGFSGRNKRKVDVRNYNTDDWGERIQRVFSKKVQRVKGFSWCEDVRRIEDFYGRSDVPEPLVRGSHDGYTKRTHRLRVLGNAVVPQVVTHIGRCIEAFDK